MKNLYRGFLWASANPRSFHTPSRIFVDSKCVAIDGLYTYKPVDDCAMLHARARLCTTLNHKFGGGLLLEIMSFLELGPVIFGGNDKIDFYTNYYRMYQYW